MEYHNFYKLCLYYDFIESFVKYNNDIIQLRSTIIFMIKQCSAHILPTEQEFAQVLISIVQASNIKVQFKQDANSVFSVPESVRHTDFENNDNNNTCMEDIKYIVGELSGRFLFANYSTPQAKKCGQNSKQIEDSVQERRNAKKPKLMSYDDTLELLDNNNESEIFSPPFQPYSPTDSDLDKYSAHGRCVIICSTMVD